MSHQLSGRMAAQPGNLLWLELLDGVRAEQLHRPHDVTAEDLDGAVRPGAPAGHQPVITTP